MAEQTRAIQVVADIGGTNARFAYLASGESTLKSVVSLQCGEFSRLQDAVSAYLSLIGRTDIASLCLAVAGPVENDWIDLPNNHWAFSRSGLADSLKLPVTVINDFEAQILSIGGLQEQHFHWIAQPRPDSGNNGAIAALGPGTGLGVAAMLRDGSIVPSEAGHVAFAPTSDHQLEILKILWQRHPRISVERILSGMGLENLYWAHSLLHARESQLSAADISAAARSGDDLCLKTLRDFAAILGAVAGDTALTMGAYHGVYLCGGILPKLLKDGLLDVGLIRQCFDDKGRFASRCASIPLAIVTAENSGLIGCARHDTGLSQSS